MEQNAIICPIKTWPEVTFRAKTETAGPCKHSTWSDMRKQKQDVGQPYLTDDNTVKSCGGLHESA